MLFVLFCVAASVESLPAVAKDANSPYECTVPGSGARSCGAKQKPVRALLQGATMMQNGAKQKPGRALLQGAPPAAWVQVDIEQQTSDGANGTQRAWGASGRPGVLKTQPGSACTDDFYHPSQLEQDFTYNALQWTATAQSLCSHLGTAGVTWIKQNEGLEPPGPLFSRLCKKGFPEQLVEPLAGILRDPRCFCGANGDSAGPTLLSIEFLVLADSSLVPAGARRIFYDAGGSKFGDSLQYFVESYAERGVVFDEIFVWEYTKQDIETYWQGVPAAVRQQWEPRLTFYNGIPVTAELGSPHNPVERIYTDCKPEDYCVFKLDIDAPSIEFPLVTQLIDNRAKTSAFLDEFFFEHHVTGLMQKSWGAKVEGTFADSYNIFSQLRQYGLRAHSWI